MFKVLVRVDDSGDWYSNGVRFPTKEDAESYAVSLYHRWTKVLGWVVVPATTEESTDGQIN